VSAKQGLLLLVLSGLSLPLGSAALFALGGFVNALLSNTLILELLRALCR
jgi:hypothetical protein